jgi:hypothetical protein
MFLSSLRPGEIAEVHRLENANNQDQDGWQDAGLAAESIYPG